MPRSGGGSVYTWRRTPAPGHEGDTRQWYAHTKLMLVTGGVSNGAWRAPRDSGAPLRGITCNFSPAVFFKQSVGEQPVCRWKRTAWQSPQHR